VTPALSSTNTPVTSELSSSSTSMTPELTIISNRIIGCAQIVSTTLGSGLPEIIYENAFAHELRKEGLAVGQQEAVPVYYDGTMVGDYTADLLVAGCVMVELTTTSSNATDYIAECKNYLQATGIPLCMLITFNGTSLGTQCVVKGS
jgi:GxxExxY protein